MSLCAIFDQRKSQLRRDRLNLLERDHLTIEVHHHDRFGFAVDNSLDRLRIDEESVSIDIYKPRNGM